MEKILIWGTGDVAQNIFEKCLTLDEYEFVGAIDNDIFKEGKTFRGIKIYNPCRIHDIEYDKIVVLNNSYNEIVMQIKEMDENILSSVENKYYFFKNSILKRYENEKNEERKELISYIKNKGLGIFNYDYVDKYYEQTYDIKQDSLNGMFFVIHKGKKLYFSRRYKTKHSVEEYYRSILIEQDIKSPHRYFSKNFFVDDNDVVIDLGAAEGIFSLEVIEKASKIYLFEADDYWIEALESTFAEYKDKVSIVKGFFTSYNEGKFMTLDSQVREKVDVIKMDIEGNEWDALQGANKLIDLSNSIKMAICSYHSDFDQILIEDWCVQHGLCHATSDGYMWFPYDIRQTNVSTKFVKGVVYAFKC